MQADDPGPALGPRGVREAADRDRTGVGGEDGSVGRRGIQPGEQVALDRFILESGFNREVDPGGGGLERVGNGDTGEGGVAGLAGDLLLRHGTIEVAGDPAQARFGAGALGLEDQDIVPGHGHHLGDPVSHQADPAHQHPARLHGADHSAAQAPRGVAPRRLM